jgi:hypothetical protein
MINDQSLIIIFKPYFRVLFITNTELLKIMTIMRSSTKKLPRTTSLPCNSMILQTQYRV